jgi:hypothetical protein
VRIGETSKLQRGLTPGNPRCEHDAPIVVTPTETGYYARCLRCQELGPERPNSEAARRALVVRGSRSDEQPSTKDSQGRGHSKTRTKMTPVH